MRFNINEASSLYYRTRYAEDRRGPERISFAEITFQRSSSNLRSHLRSHLRRRPPAAVRRQERSAMTGGPVGAIKVHYFNNRTDSSEPAEPRRQETTSAGSRPGGKETPKSRPPNNRMCSCSVPGTMQLSTSMNLSRPPNDPSILPPSLLLGSPSRRQPLYRRPLLDSSNSASFRNSLFPLTVPSFLYALESRADHAIRRMSALRSLERRRP